jgi:hypothetical protein
MQGVAAKADALASESRDNTADGFTPPQPEGRMGVAAKYFVARRRRYSSIAFLLAPRLYLAIPMRAA